MRVSRAVPLLSVLLVSFFVSGCFRFVLDDDDKSSGNGEVVYPSNQNDRLVLSDVTWEQPDDESYNNLVVSGKISNTGTIEVAEVRICMKAYDSSGTLIANEDTAESSLDGKTKIAWEITCHVDEEPTKVTVGYSYNAEIVVAAKKKLQ